MSKSSKPPTTSVGSGKAIARKDLYELLWREPAYKVAELFGVSGVALAKACGRARIPLPPRGHWVRVQHGARVRRPPLAKVKDEKPVVIGLRERRAEEQPESLPADVRGEVDDVLNAPPLRVRKRVDKPHRLLTWMTERRMDAVQRRRVALLDALLREFERRGYRVDGQWNDLSVSDGSEPVGFSLDERMRQRRVPDELRRGGFTQLREASGILRFRFSPRYGMRDRLEWSDESERPLETRLNEVVAGLLVVFYRLRELRRKREEEERRRWEAEHRRWVQEERVKKMLSHCERRERACAVRAHVEEVRSTFKGLGEDALSTWSEWALAYADSIDPFVGNDVRRFVEEFGVADGDGD